VRVFHPYNLQIMPGELLNHSGTRKIECLEEQGDAVWELDRTSQTLTFTGLVRTTEGIGGLLVSSVIHHITLEIVLPLERMISTLGLDRAREDSTSERARGPRPRFRHTARISVRPPVVYHFEDDPEEDGADMTVTDVGVSGRGEDETDPSEDLGVGGANGDLPNGR
jgi:hypothetical protein